VRIMNLVGISAAIRVEYSSASQKRALFSDINGGRDHFWDCLGMTLARKLDPL
jgi:hypothetical protein